MGVSLKCFNALNQKLSLVHVAADEALNNVDGFLLILDLDIEALVIGIQRGDFNLELCSALFQNVNFSVERSVAGLGIRPFLVDDRDALIEAQQSIVERCREVSDDLDILLQGVIALFVISLNVDVDISV